MISSLQATPGAFRNDALCMKLYEQFRLASRGLSDEQAGAEIRGVLQRHGQIRSHIDFLEQNLGADIQVAGDRGSARYVNDQQRVTYEIHFIHSKREFKTALETEGIIVIYAGHSRYGRGACFDVYPNQYSEHGEHWEDGTDDDDGLYRLGYPYFGVPLTDIEHHQYHFAPIAAEAPQPERRWRHPRRLHPHVRRRWTRIVMPENLRRYVRPEFASLTHRYWGFTRRRETNIILIAGWIGSAAAPYDLGATEMRCRTLCHFGCSSRLHFWDIVRRPQYKGYLRNRPPTEKFAYFTIEPANYKTIYWLYFLLSYSGANSPTHWWDSHEYAKRMANRRLRRERMGFLIY